MRSISFKPLTVRPPSVANAGVWFLKENPRVLIIGDRLREFLLAYDSSLKFERVYDDGEYTAPSAGAEGVGRDDLG